MLADATVHAVQRAWRCSLTAETLASASWAMPEHASSMARPTADDILMVHDDEEVGVDERRCVMLHVPSSMLRTAGLLIAALSTIH